MEHPPRKQGRPTKDPARHKRNRGISMTDAEYAKLIELATAENKGISEYIITKLGLS
ncbi:hypothetical protein [Hymenobacter sp. AT01-02]|uniref:hypothetical protein n=1 Tax=Hymenobacter sp. AT01-02 TaxID=1571877 RepID=UPI0013792869|nr:hypothetical protein [Hymenobacter sp. AT01-02]